MEASTSNISIKQASLADVPEIRDFIDEHWKEGHILARDPAFFDYEHVSHEEVRFVIARNTDNKIVGTLGYLPFAPGEETDISTVIWKVAKSGGAPGLGIRLLQHVRELDGVRTATSVGINKKTLGIYRFLEMHTGELKQYVLFNEELDQLKIAKRLQKRDASVNQRTDDRYKFQILKEEADLAQFNFEQFREQIPYRNQSYFIKRFFKHPIYQYQVIGIYLENKLCAMLVGRVQEYEGNTALRLVDYYGLHEHMACIGPYLSGLLIKEGHEYADFYTFGFEESALEDAGFDLVDPSSEDVIVPNYFAPFVQKNVKILFFADTNKPETLCFYKADGDQDRPN